MLIAIAVASLLLAAGVIYLVVFLVQDYYPERKKLWVSIPINTFAFVTNKDSKNGKITEGGGGVFDILHNVPGKRLDKSSDDPLEWEFIDGEEKRSWLFHLLGVEWIGPFRTLRTNTLRRFRYSKRDGSVRDNIASSFTDYEIESDDLKTAYVPYSGEQAVVINGAESKSIFRLNFLLNIIEESVHPLKSVVRVADANAILAGIIKEKINAVTGTEEPQFFMKPSTGTTAALIEAAMQGRKEAEDEIGKRLMKVNLVATDMSDSDRKLFELEARTNTENAAKLAVAKTDANVKIEQARGEGESIVKISEAKKAAKLNENAAEADRVEKVLIPLSTDENRLAAFKTDREAEAYETNTHVTTWVGGGGASPVVPLGK